MLIPYRSPVLEEGSLTILTAEDKPAFHDIGKDKNPFRLSPKLLRSRFGVIKGLQRRLYFPVDFTLGAPMHWVEADQSKEENTQDQDSHE